MSYRLTPISLLLALCSTAFAGTSICDGDECLLIGTPPPHLPAEADGAVRAILDGRDLYINGQKVASFRRDNARIVIGDWNGDGFDEPGAYAYGKWTLQMGWEATASQQEVDMGVLSPGPNAVPLVGSWEGSSVDGIGVYDNGVFTLYSDYADLSHSIVIDFGEVANNTGTVWESMPFVGPIDQVMDRVGLSKGVSVAYAPHNGGAKYNFSDGDATLVSATLPFRGFLDAGHARPYVVDADLLDLPDKTGYILAFRYLPGMEPTASDQCIPTGGYICVDEDIGRPDASGAVIIPNPGPFH